MTNMGTKRSRAEASKKKKGGQGKGPRDRRDRARKVSRIRSRDICAHAAISEIVRQSVGALLCAEGSSAKPPPPSLCPLFQNATAGYHCYHLHLEEGAEGETASHPQPAHLPSPSSLPESGSGWGKSRV